jgi:hypothetical protein
VTVNVKASALVLWTLVVTLAAGCGAMNSASSPDAAAPAAREALGMAADSQAPGSAESASGEVTTWKRSQLVPNTSKLMVGDSESLALSSMQIRATVEGFRARVVLDYYFGNTYDRQLEGTFKARLPDGASPYFFAYGQTALVANENVPVMAVEASQKMGTEPRQLMAAREESWIGPHEARMVPREQAAIAFGSTVRRAVDPALMEWSGAGVFSARVFPIAPGKQHRIVLAYDMDLTFAGADQELAIDLPEGVPSLTVDFDVAKLPGATLTTTPAAQPVARGERLFYRYEQPSERTIALRVGAPPTTVLTSTDDVGPTFATSFVPKVAAVAGGKGADRAVLLLDTSLSANPDGFNVWLKLARALLDENRDTIKEFAVLFFNVEASWWKASWAENSPENVTAFLAAANDLVLEGATDVATALRTASRPKWDRGAAPDLFLLSDGAATWGESDGFATAAAAGKSTVFAYRTGMAGTDVTALETITRQSGGAIFSVVGEAEVAAAATAHRSRPWRIAQVELEGASDLLLAGRPQVIFPGQRLMLAGRGTPATGSQVELTLTSGGQEQKVKVALAHARESVLAPRAYGQIAVAQLEELAPATDRTATAYALHYRVTGKTCSLLMLESEEDYQRFNIQPTATAGEIAQRPAGAEVAAVLSRIAGSLGDPKAQLLAWLDKLKTTPGVELSISSRLKKTLADLPSEAFELPLAPLAVKGRTQASTSKGFLGRLRKRDVDYQAFTAESARRSKKYGKGDGIKVLSSLVEQNPGDAVLARDVGMSAMSAGLNRQAFHLFRRVAEARPFEPQTFRAMAHAAEKAGKVELAMAFYEVGLAGKWDTRFGEYTTIMTYDYVRMLNRVAQGELSSDAGAYMRSRFKALRSQVQIGANLVVMITWNTDNTDVDLHVIEPSGEECFYSHPTTESGGHITRDVTQGYGPEMYVLDRAPEGAYEVNVHYYATDTNRMSARSKVEIAVFENFGTKDERVTRKVVTLALNKEDHRIATVEVGGKGGVVMAR